MRPLAKGSILPLLVLAAWLGVLAWWTSGFTAFTTFSNTLRAAGPLPRPAPVFEIRDQFGSVHETSEFHGRYVLLQFSYLHCGDVCPITMAETYRVHDALARSIPGELVLLTISFDPQRDTTERLLETWRHYGRPAGWTMAALAAPLDDESQADLRRLGVFVSRRDDGLFSHSGQAFLLDPHGQVVQVFEGPGNVAAIIGALEAKTS